MDGLIPFETLEQSVKSRCLEWGAEIVRTMLNHAANQMPARLRAPNGEILTRAGKREKTFVTVLGDITIVRAYYTDGQGNGYFPLDEKLGLERDSLSDGVKRMIGHTASVLSFKESSDMIENLANLHVGVKQVERTAESLGEQIATDEQSRVPEGKPCGNTMYLGMDGTGCRVRGSEAEGRKGKQEDGSAKTREVKLAVCYSADGRNKDGEPQRDERSVSYNGAIESAACGDLDVDISDFGKRVGRESIRRGFDKAEQTVIIGDGAAWIWNIAFEQFPDAVQIIDMYHAKGTVSSAAKSIFGQKSESGEQYGKRWRDMLEAGQSDRIVDQLEPHIGKVKEAKTCRDYLIKNKNRLNYPRFKKMGLCTSSGIVESGCKHAIGARVKQSGMHWTVRGANAIIALRCAKLNGQLDEFMNRRRAA